MTKLFIPLLLLSMLASAQQATPVKKLQAFESKVTEVPAFGFMQHAQCDVGDSSYFMMNEGEASFRDTKILKLSTDDAPTLFSPPDELSSKIAFAGFAVEHSGEHVWLLNQFSDGSYVFQFSQDGSLQRKIKLDLSRTFDPQLFSSSDGSTFFIAGVLNGFAPADEHGKHFAALFNSEGQLISSLRDEATFAVNSNIADGIDADWAAVTDSDGTTYFARRGQIAAISSNGKLLRNLAVERPRASSWMSNLSISNNHLIVEFSDISETLYSKLSIIVINKVTGSNIEHQEFPPDAGNTLVCSKSGYRLLTIEDQHVKYLRFRQ